MVGIGTVVSVSAGQAEVEVRRESACAMMHEDGCGECHGCDSALREVRTVMNDPIGVQVGDRVAFSSPSKNIIFLAILVFALPIAVMVGVYFLLNLFFAEATSVLGALIAAALWFLLLRIFDKPLGAYARCKIDQVVHQAADE